MGYACVYACFSLRLGCRISRQVQGLYSFAIEMIFGLTVNDVRIEEVTGDLRSCLPSIDRSVDASLHGGILLPVPAFFRTFSQLTFLVSLPILQRLAGACTSLMPKCIPRVP